MAGEGSTAQLQSLLPEYLIERELGRGAMGVVHLARHQRLDRLVAVKELQGVLAADPATRERFAVEARALALLDHPHVVPVFDYVERDGHCVLIMEQLPGGTVWDRFTEHGVTLSQATAITLATCSALAHAHTQGILHRDIKPENLMFATDGALKVTDFGIARMVNGSSTKATMDGSVLGTPAYMAPEQAAGRPIGPAADVYATATMFYELTSGVLPFAPTDSVVEMLAARIGTDPVELREVADRVPPSIAAVTMRGLARQLDHRTASPEQFGTELAAAAASEWGPDWIDSTGLTVRGSTPIDRAARTTNSTVTPARPRPTTGHSTIVSGDATSRLPGADATVVPGVSTPADAPPTEGPAEAPAANGAGPGETASGETAPSEPVPTPREPEPSSATVSVTPGASDRDLGRLDDASGRDFVDIARLTEVPRRPVATLLVALGVLVAGAIWAVLGAGAAAPSANTLLVDAQPTTEVIEIDLSAPLVIQNAPPGSALTITFNQLGVDLGSTETVDVDAQGAAIVDPGIISNVSSGSMTATSETADGMFTSETEFTATNPWYLTAIGVGVVISTLLALAIIESNLRAVRRGRGPVSAAVGLIAGGALLGASLAVGSTVVLGRPHDLTSVAGPAALVAIGVVLLGLTTRAARRRRTISRRNTRNAALATLNSR